MKKQTKLIIWLACILVAALTPAAGRGAQSSSEVLARIRAAVGYERLQSYTSGIVAEGIAHSGGLDSKSIFLFTPDGRFRSKVEGPLGRTVGFDGTTVWEVDSSGMPRVLELEDLEVEQFRAWIRSGRWLAENGPFVVTLEQKKTDEQRVALSLKLKGGLLEATVFIERSTWLPKTVIRPSTAGEEVIELGDYREALGFRLPHSLTRTLGTAKSVLEVRSMVTAQGTPRASFAPVTARPADTSWNASAPARVEARRAGSGHMLVHPLVNGKDVGWFLLDTGASVMAIDTKVADRLGMRAFGEVVALGAAGSTKTRFRQGEALELGPMNIKGTHYMELDLSGFSGFGVPLAGVCGQDLFERAVVELDISNGSVALYDPARYRLEGGAWQELFFSNHVPIVSARFEGHEGLFRLDTGSDRTVSIHAPAVVRYGLLSGRETGEGGGNGVGGSLVSRMGKVTWFELAGRRFEDLDAELATTTSGAFSDPYTLGNIGVGILRAFRIVFDFGNKQAAFLPLKAAQA